MEWCRDVSYLSMEGIILPSYYSGGIVVREKGTNTRRRSPDGFCWNHHFRWNGRNSCFSFFFDG